MLHPFPQGSGLVAGFPMPKSKPSTLTPIRGTALPLLSYTLVLPGSVRSHPEIMGAQGGEVQGGFAVTEADEEVAEDVFVTDEVVLFVEEAEVEVVLG